MLAALGIAACGDAGGAGSAETGDTPPVPDQEHYDRIVGSAATIDRAPLSLCQLIRHPMFDAIGRYRVTRLTGVREADLSNGGTMAGFTYVELALLDGYYRADEDAVARVSGGILDDGSSGGWDVSLAVDEEVILLLTRATPDNRDHPGIHLSAVFHRDAEGRFSSLDFFHDGGVEADELEGYVTTLAGGTLDGPCEVDVAPDGA